MKLRLLNKNDGTTVLQVQTSYFICGNEYSEWEDVEVVNEYELPLNEQTPAKYP